MSAAGEARASVCSIWVAYERPPGGSILWLTGSIGKNLHRCNTPKASFVRVSQGDY